MGELTGLRAPPAPVRPRRPRLVALRALAVGVGLLLALAIGELALRALARVRPDVRHLATAGSSQPARRFGSLAEYLAGNGEHLVPHRPFFNHWTNALGFYDEEFVVPKPAGRFRIMAVGDSFTFGLVPYPATAMTLLERLIRAACSGLDLDLLNFGVGGAQVHDYRTLVELAYGTYQPDLVLLNFYAGNDGPDLVSRARQHGTARAALRRSYLWTYARNALRLYRSVADPAALAGRPEAPSAAGRRPRGGDVVDPDAGAPEDAPALAGPVFEEKAFLQIQADELGRLYLPGDAAQVGGAWERTLEHLEAIRTLVTRDGGRLVIALYPSALQLDADLRTGVIQRLRARARYAGLAAEAIDPELPNRVLAGYCRARGLACLDVMPALRQAGRDSPAPLYKARDSHWTLRGNRVAAEAQAAQLAPLVCGPGARAARTGW